MDPGVIKRSKTVSSFKIAYRRHREDMVKTTRLAQRRRPAMAGPHPDPDTSYETLHGPLDVNLQVRYTQVSKRSVGIRDILVRIRI
jgi:hypothetical protein